MTMLRLTIAAAAVTLEPEFSAAQVGRVTAKLAKVLRTKSLFLMLFLLTPQ